jgi:hypothetical protein
MPVRNQLFGVYKLVELKTADGYRPFVVENASRNRKMNVSSKNYVQGTAKSRILDIAEITEEISITLPILLGGAQVMDGRSLIAYYLSEALKEDTTVLPLITNATINIAADSGASVSVKLLSDGRPTTQSFKVTNRPVDKIAVEGVTAPLDPTVSTPSRVARFYDFRARIGKYVYYIISASITIQVDTVNKYFIAGIPDENEWQATEMYYADAMNNDSQNPLKSTDENNFYNFNTQFPFIGVTGIKVSGRGSAAVELNQAYEDDPETYDFDDYFSQEAKWEAVNADFTVDGGTGGSQYDLTWQRPGEVQTSTEQSGDGDASSFKLQIWNPDTGASGSWVDLLAYSNGDPVLDLSNSVVSSSNFKIDTGVMTADFDFVNWVK